MGIPVAHSLMGKGALPDDHPLTLGMTGFWGTKFINDKCRGADWVLALGTRFKEADSQFLGAGIHVRISADQAHPHRHRAERDRPQLSDRDRRGRRPQAGAEDAKPRGQRALSDGRAATKHWNARSPRYRDEFKASNRAMEESDDFPMMPERILADVRAVLPRDAIITTDVGWNKNGVGQQFPIYTPGSMLTPGGYATMGFGPPAALGAKIAAPDRVVISLVGDGGFGQNPSVLATAAEEESGGGLGGDEQQRLRHHRRPAESPFRHDVRHRRSPVTGAEFRRTTRRSPEAYGIDGVRIRSPAEFKPALEKAITSGKPCVIDVAMRTIRRRPPATGTSSTSIRRARRSSHVSTD